MQVADTKAPNTIRAIETASVNLRSSTDYNSNHGVKNCMLNFKNNDLNSGDGSEAWCASVLDTNQYILAGGDVPKTFVALALQGRGDADQWVTSFKVTYSLDNLNWFEYENGKVFQGVKDRNTVVPLFFDPPIEARSVCLHPVTWHNHISLRWELYYQPLEVPPQIAQGSISIGDRSLNDANQSGARIAERPVIFAKPLKFIPRVVIGLRLIDSGDDNGQTRITVEATNVTEKGFTAVFKTWAKSTVYEATADYIAIADGSVETLKPQSRFFWIPLNIPRPAAPAPTTNTTVNLSNIANYGNIIINIGK
eukprot:gene2327-2873_t